MGKHVKFRITPGEIKEYFLKDCGEDLAIITSVAMGKGRIKVHYADGGGECKICAEEPHVLVESILKDRIESIDEIFKTAIFEGYRYVSSEGLFLFYDVSRTLEDFQYHDDPTVNLGNRTNRGFAFTQFEDDNGNSCSVQESSSMTPRLWVGIDDADPHVLASKAKSLGVETESTVGWVPYPISKEVLMTTRMHLTKDQTVDLIKVLIAWVAETTEDEAQQQSQQ
jgi:hypothetical protein